MGSFTNNSLSWVFKVNNQRAGIWDYLNIKNGSVFEIRLSNVLAQKFKNYNIYIDSIEKFGQKSLVQINFHWSWATGPLLKSMTDG